MVMVKSEIFWHIALHQRNYPFPRKRHFWAETGAYIEFFLHFHVNKKKKPFGQIKRSTYINPLYNYGSWEYSVTSWSINYKIISHRFWASSSVGSFILEFLFFFRQPVSQKAPRIWTKSRREEKANLCFQVWEENLFPISNTTPNLSISKQKLCVLHHHQSLNL